MVFGTTRAILAESMTARDQQRVHVYPKVNQLVVDAFWSALRKGCSVGAVEHQPEAPLHLALPICGFINNFHKCAESKVIGFVKGR